MKLSHLCACLGAVPSGPGDVEIRGLTCDSRRAEPGCLFAALPGARADGLDFIPQALERGAAAVLAEQAVEDLSVPLVTVPDARQALALLAAEFYGHPAEKLTLVGITGTKGKTTTAHILKSILETAGHRTAMSGTLGGFIGGEQVLEPGNTTPEPVALHRFFARAAEAGCSHLVMEVSSQGLKQGRVWGVEFDLALFLNLSPDHIGGAEHADFAEYLHCKSLLFRQCTAALANADGPHWRQVTAGCAAVTTFGFSPGADVRGGAVRPFREDGVLGCEFPVGGWEEPLRVCLPGPCNAADALAAAAAARTLGIPEAAVREGLRTVRVPGRAELMPLPGGVTAVIDYAHNGASFESILSILADYDHERLIVVFGAGGDRPKLRRRDMADVAARYAHFAVVTADNPRWERVEDICGDIVEALAGRIPCRVIYDRAEAIRYALDMARPGDIVALLGKGHEAYIETRGLRRPFSERAVVEAWRAERPADG